MSRPWEKRQRRRRRKPKNKNNLKNKAQARLLRRAGKTPPAPPGPTRPAARRKKRGKGEKRPFSPLLSSKLRPAAAAARRRRKALPGLVAPQSRRAHAPLFLQRTHPIHQATSIGPHGPFALALALALVLSCRFLFPEHAGNCSFVSGPPTGRGEGLKRPAPGRIDVAPLK